MNEKENRYEFKGIEVKDSPGKQGVGVFIKKSNKDRDQFYHNLLIPFGGIKITKVGLVVSSYII